MQQQRSRAPSKAIPSSMSAKPRDNQLHIYSIFFEDVMKSEWDCCLFSESRVVQMIVQLKGNTVYTWAAWWNLNSVSKLIDDYGQHDCGRFCNSIDSNGSVCFSLSSLFLTEEPHEQVVHPTPQTSMQTKTNPTSQQSPVDSWQYKMTTTKHQSIHQLFIEITKTTNQQKGSCCFVCFRQSQVKW